MANDKKIEKAAVMYIKYSPLNLRSLSPMAMVEKTYTAQPIAAARTKRSKYLLTVNRKYVDPAKDISPAAGKRATPTGASGS